ncbi:Protein of uncharacterised function (DUF2922) [Peptoniphilus harei]|uniref:DUF2922 domain-containing protein n=1 Tax=Peptoniphilus TaxID=162289 RepID=UPI0008A31241|nr:MULTISPECIES: DUF2922 domain-containing protein [Peptoniphilus]MDU1177374.1 DUF2922 domain-containing protein [Peptoniphilus harei]OFO62472.1 hypothetical protein HMPREF3023_07915 [Peptoniphilus sp. HMSC075B08]QQE46966.1 DUF2922 domain-containing protein [Peptoniphilus harei]VEJ34816.1 Protein of uncharacterised function (DUF2922) [Peptoniphilus harei]
MKETKSLRISFTDEGGKPWTLTISNPQDGIVETDVKRVTDNIINNKLVSGKLGLIKTYNGSVIVTRKEEALQ